MVKHRGPGIWYSGGPVPALITPTPTPQLPGPVNVTLPVASGPLLAGSTLNVTLGTWLNNPTNYLYQWKSAGVDVGINSNSYTTTTGDAGKNVFCEITAVNPYGSAVAASNILVPSVFLPIVYDTRWGTSTDANGMITQNLGATNRAIYLSPATGNDANTGFSHAQALANFNTAWTLFLAGKPGDKLLIAQGSTVTDTTSSSITALVVPSAVPTPGPANLTCIQSYDPADSTNQAKWGRALGGSMFTLIVNPTTGTSLNIYNIEGAGYVMVQGGLIKCTSNTSAATAMDITWVTNNHPGMVMQNCRFDGVGISKDPATGSVTSGANTQNAGLISKCSFINASGLFVESNENFQIQEVFGLHGGWDIQAVRDDPIAYGGPSFFSHFFYLHASNTNMHLNRVIVADAVDGLGARCGAVSANQLISIDNPVGITAGGKSSDVVAERPDGAPWNCDDVVIMGSDKKIQADSPGGWGLEFLNTINGAYCRNVALFDFDSYSFDASYNRYSAGSRLSASQVPTYMLCDKWSGYQFAITAETDVIVSGDPANYHLSYTNSVLDVLPTGFNGAVTNVTTRAVAPVGYKTRAQTWVALGYATKADFCNALVFRPDLIGQYVQAICGISLPAMGLTPLYQTVVPPAPVVGAPIIYKNALTDLTASTLNFTRGIPAAILLSGTAACSVLSCADFPAGFGNTPFRLQTTGTVTSGSNQITLVGSTAGVLKGMLVEAKTNAFTLTSLFPLGTVVTNIVGATITCSANATGNSAGEAIFVSAGGRLISYDGSGSGAATPTIHVLETAKDTAMGTHTTAFILNIASGVVGTVWAANADYTRSNGNLTVLRSGTGTFWGYELTSVAKTNGTADFTVDAMGSATNNYVGINDGTEASSPGFNHSMFWRQDGALLYAGTQIATLAAWTTADKLRIVKAAGNYTFYKWITGAWVQQGSTIDSTSATYGLGTVLAGNCYPSLASWNNTGFQVTADFSAF